MEPNNTNSKSGLFDLPTLTTATPAFDFKNTQTPGIMDQLQFNNGANVTPTPNLLNGGILPPVDMTGFGGDSIGGNTGVNPGVWDSIMDFFGGKTGLLGGTNEQGDKVNGSIPAILQGLQGIMSYGLGKDQLGVAKDYLKMDKEAFRTNQDLLAQENDRLLQSRASQTGS